MKKKYTLLLLVCLSSCFNQNKEENSNTQNNFDMSFYDFTMTSIDGKQINFSRYKGKKLLLVNVASKCGYTPQYADLEMLYQKYKSKNFEILGFPANNFGGQEPGTNAEIAMFCEKNYGVTFQLFEKISVKGTDQHSLYKWLSNPSENGWNSKIPNWNFCKYLVNEQGSLVKFYPSSINPSDEAIISWIRQ